MERGEDTERNAVEHKYHDYSNETTTSSDSNDSSWKMGLADARPSAKGGVIIPFPVKLHEMLDQIEEDGLASVISWQPHGRCFVVHDQKRFVDHIMPTYFRQTKFASFQRQLNLYGFSRLTSGRDKGGYYHELFLRGKRFLCHRIQRIKIKGTGVRKASSPETEPQFYAMTPVGVSNTPSTSVPTNVASANVDRFAATVASRSSWTSQVAAGTATATTEAALLMQQQQQQKQQALTSQAPAALDVSWAAQTTSPFRAAALGNLDQQLVAQSLQQNQIQQQPTPPTQLPSFLSQQLSSMNPVAASNSSISIQQRLQELQLLLRQRQEQQETAALEQRFLCQQQQQQILSMLPTNQTMAPVPAFVGSGSFAGGAAAAAAAAEQQQLAAAGGLAALQALSSPTTQLSNQGFLDRPFGFESEIAGGDSEHEFDAVLSALVKMPVETDALHSNPFAQDESLGNLLERLTE